jgi:hypothetical protein
MFGDNSKIEPDYTALLERYKALSAIDLLELNEQRANLLPIAQQALIHVVSSRRSEIEAAQRARSVDEAADSAWYERQFTIDEERRTVQVVDVTPNKSLQRAGTHKVLSRGRAITSWAGAARPRSVRLRRAAAELSRWAT